MMLELAVDRMPMGIGKRCRFYKSNFSLVASHRKVCGLTHGCCLQNTAKEEIRVDSRDSRFCFLGDLGVLAVPNFMVGAHENSRSRHRSDEAGCRRHSDGGRSSFSFDCDGGYHRRPRLPNPPKPRLRPNPRRPNPPRLNPKPPRRPVPMYNENPLRRPTKPRLNPPP